MTNETRYDHRAVDDLLRAAKEHFLKSGYEKASLRKICASAGVTTGALYFSFANKEALFDALVGPTLHKLDAILDEVERKVLVEGGKNFDANAFNDFIFKFLIDNKDGIRLLMARAEGSQYEDFAQKIHTHVERLMALPGPSAGSKWTRPLSVSSPTCISPLCPTSSPGTTITTRWTGWRERFAPVWNRVFTPCWNSGRRKVDIPLPFGVES